MSQQDPSQPFVPSQSYVPEASPQGHAAMPPGWYPNGTGTQGWWDGQRWTGQTAPLLQQPVIIQQKRGIGALGVVGILALVGVGGFVVLILVVALAIGSGGGSDVRTSVTTSDGGQTITLLGDKSTFTKGQQEAIGSAEDYLSGQDFSRAGLIHQLTSSVGEGFSGADATFAVDHLQVDWNYEAYLSAKDYLNSSHFSLTGLVHQLESEAGERFTHAQAVYGATRAYNEG